MGILKSVVEVDGLQYELQHPGAREWIRLQQSLNEVIPDKNGSGYFRLNIEKLLDYGFDHVISPMGHGFCPSLDRLAESDDEVAALRAMEVWTLILPRFLRGEFTNVVESAPDNSEDSIRDTRPVECSPSNVASEERIAEEPAETTNVAGNIGRGDNSSRHRRRNRAGVA